MQIPNRPGLDKTFRNQLFIFPKAHKNIPLIILSALKKNYLIIIDIQHYLFWCNGPAYNAIAPAHSFYRSLFVNGSLSQT